MELITQECPVATDTRPHCPTLCVTQVTLCGPFLFCKPSGPTCNWWEFIHQERSCAMPAGGACFTPKRSFL